MLWPLCHGPFRTEMDVGFFDPSGHRPPSSPVWTWLTSGAEFTPGSMAHHHDDRELLLRLGGTDLRGGARRRKAAQDERAGEEWWE